MKILVTGGAGFIGSAFVRHVLNFTDHVVVNVDKLTYAGNLESIPDADLNPRYCLEMADICDADTVARLFEQHQPTAVIHLAAESHVDRSIDGPRNFIQTNIFGTYTLLEEARAYYENLDDERKNRFRFHHVSTDEVYGDLAKTGERFSENSAYAPSSPYSASKASADHLVRSWYRTYGLPVIVTNCSNNYGPFQFPEKLIPHIILNALHGDALPVYGDGSHVRDWLYVDDHVRALLRVLSDGRVGETYNIGGYVEMKNIEVVENVCALLDDLVPQKRGRVSHYADLIEFVADRPGHDSRYAVDASKMQRDLDWVPEENFESGLRKTVQWYLNNEAWWNRILSKAYRLDRVGRGDGHAI